MGCFISSNSGSGGSSGVIIDDILTGYFEVLMDESGNLLTGV